jgi:hypothetical protein
VNHKPFRLKVNISLGGDKCPVNQEFIFHFAAFESILTEQLSGNILLDTGCPPPISVL